MTYPRDALIQMPITSYDAQLETERQDAARAAIEELNALRDNLRNVLQLGEKDDPAVAIGVLVTERNNAVTAHERLARGYDELVEKHANLQRAYDVLSDDSETCVDENKRLAEERDQLRAKLAELTKPPEIEPPDMPDTQPVIIDPDPVTVKPALKGVRGIIITKDDAPTPRQDEMTRDLIDLCGGMGFTHWRGLLNFEEVAKQRKLPASDPANLPAYGRAHSMAYVADSVDSQMKRLLALSARQTYFEGLKELGAVAVYFDDVDKADKAPFIHEWLAFARDGMKAANFKVPLIGSFTANVKRGVYDVDQIEIQTYGSLADFKNFLMRDADLLCIDGRAKATPEYIEAMTKLVAGSHRDFFVYAAKSRDGTNWLNSNMTETVNIYDEFMDGLKAQRPVS